MRCLDFPAANTNLFPQINKGNPVYCQESGLIPAAKQENGTISILLELSQDELNAVIRHRGKLFLTFAKQNDVSSIQSGIFPSFLVEEGEEIGVREKFNG